VSSLRVGTPSRAAELRRPEAVALATHAATATNFSDALDSATNAPALTQPREGERHGPFAEGWSTPAAAPVPTPARSLADAAGVDHAAPADLGVNAKAGPQKSADVLGITVSPLDPGRPQTLVSPQTTAQPSVPSPPPAAPSLGEEPSKPGRQTSGQNPEPEGRPSAADFAADPAQSSPGQNPHISLIATPDSGHWFGFARELFENGIEPDPIGPPTAHELPTRRLNATANAASATTVDGRRSDRNRPVAQTGTLDTALGVVNPVPTSALLDGNTAPLPWADHGDDRRPDRVGVESTTGPERRGEAGVAARSDHDSNRSAAAESNADPAGQQIVTEQEPAINAPNSLAPASAAESRGYSSTTGLASINSVAAQRSIALAGSVPSDGLIVATSPSPGSASAASDPSIVIAAAVAGSAPNTAAGGLPDENSPSASVATSLPADLPDRLLHGVIGSIESPGREIVLRLDPPELGNLTVRVLVSGREVATWFATPQAQLQQAIGQAIGQLQTELSNAGYTLSGVWVGADASNPRDRGASLPLPRERLAAARVEPQTTPATEIPSSSSGVSIYV
jgi:flagellar hook-length control protein FliK